MGARKRLPVHPVLSTLRTLGTLAVLIALLGAIVTTSRASAQIDGGTINQVAKVEDVLQALKSNSSDRDSDSDAANSTSIRDDERTPDIFGDSSEANTADRDNREATESGIDGTEYVSPTYGFAVEWDEAVWTVALDAEMVNAFPNNTALDRLVLENEGAVLYIEGRTDYDAGDLEDCVDRDIAAIGQNSTISNLEIRDDEHGDPMVGETADGAFKVITLTMDDTNLAEYIECRPVDEGESVLVITLIATASKLDDATGAMRDVVDTIVI